jgi:alkylated DNA repair dioxygenase AlkB
MLHIKTETSWLQSIPFEDTVLLDRCVDHVKTRLSVRPEIMIFGKLAHQQRDVGFFSDKSAGYKYSNRVIPAQPMTAELLDLLEFTNKEFGTSFNAILVNRYLNGTQYIGKHSDDESNLTNDGVVSLSYGTPRIFRIRDKKTGTIVVDVKTVHSEFLQMGGDFQKKFTHEIPIEKKINTPRMSFTFRKHLQ